ncbi:hypothetical protein Tco_0180786 [Tanacetum coccineum]
MSVFLVVMRPFTFLIDLCSILACCTFSLTRRHGLKINLSKSQLLGVGVDSATVYSAALNIGCSVMKTPFKYLRVMVGGNMAKLKAWDETILKLKSRLSEWKIYTLFIGGRLTLLKSVLGFTPIYSMSMYKVPKSILNLLESLRRNFFNGVQGDERKISWVKWSKVLASRKHGGLGVSSFFALNRALLFKWVWRFISHDNSLWYRFISAMHGSNIQMGLVFILVFGMTSGMEILSFVLFFRGGVFRRVMNLNKLEGSSRSIRFRLSCSDSIDRWVGI